ncbi:hypothetical protein [Ancylobacter sp.]|uniref:hypothetical protein n=1 Tax=Ancylobacter sp. TaxID=1872567 RepID=UPI003BAD3518
MKEHEAGMLVSDLCGKRGQRRQRNRPAAANDNATTGALPAPRTMADLVNNVDQSRQMQQTVTVNNSVTVNATTNATPAAISTATAGATERGTRRAMSGFTMLDLRDRPIWRAPKRNLSGFVRCRPG